MRIIHFGSNNARADTQGQSATALHAYKSLRWRQVKSHAQRERLDMSWGFPEGEWLLIRTLADGLERAYGLGVP